MHFMLFLRDPLISLKYLHFPTCNYSFFLLVQTNTACRSQPSEIFLFHCCQCYTVNIFLLSWGCQNYVVPKSLLMIVGVIPCKPVMLVQGTGTGKSAVLLTCSIIECGVSIIINKQQNYISLTLNEQNLSNCINFNFLSLLNTRNSYLNLSWTIVTHLFFFSLLLKHWWNLHGYCLFVTCANWVYSYDFFALMRSIFIYLLSLVIHFVPYFSCLKNKVMDQLQHLDTSFKVPYIWHWTVKVRKYYI